MVLQELLSAHPALSPLASTLASTGCPAPHVCHAWVCREGLLTVSSGQYPMAVVNREHLSACTVPWEPPAHSFACTLHPTRDAGQQLVLQSSAPGEHPTMHRGLNCSFLISAHPRNKNVEKLCFSFPSSIFALGWEWDFDLRNNKPNNGKCVTIDLQLAEGAG